MGKELGKAYTESKYIDEYLTGFVDFCQKTSDSQKCTEYAQTEIKDSYEKTFTKSKPKIENKENAFSTEDIRKLTNIFVKYHTALKKAPQELTDIKNFSNLMEAETRKLELLEELYFQYDFLSRNNFTPVTVAKAQFNHFDLFHLMGNMIFLLIFGIYVEHRISSASLLFFYMLGGTMGLLLQTYMFTPEHFLLGASANVYAVMGMFYALFYDKKMKFFIWYFISRKVTVDVKYWLPALIFANEVILSVGPTSAFTDGVAHLAHVGGLLTGIICGHFLRELSPLHENFLYQFEVTEWRAAKKSANPNLISDTAVRILSFNPFNDVVLEDFMNSIVEEYSKKPITTEFMKIAKYFPSYFRFCVNSNKYDELISTLNQLQAHTNIEPLLRYRNLGDLVTMGDACVQKNEYLLAITFYISFIHSYPNSKLAMDMQKTIKNILEHITYNEFSAGVIKRLTSNSHNVFLKKLLFDYLQQQETPKKAAEEAA